MPSLRRSTGINVTAALRASSRSDFGRGPFDRRCSLPDERIGMRSHTALILSFCHLYSYQPHNS
jgi:hypothetical protein